MAAQPPWGVAALQAQGQLLSGGTNGTPENMTRAEARYGRQAERWPRHNIAPAFLELLSLAHERRHHLTCHNRRAAQTFLRRSFAHTAHPVPPTRHVPPSAGEDPGTACFRRTRHLKSPIRAHYEPNQPVPR